MMVGYGSPFLNIDGCELLLDLGDVHATIIYYDSGPGQQLR